MEVEIYIDEHERRYQVILGADKVSLCRHHNVLPAACAVGIPVEVDTFPVPLFFTLNACGTGEFTPREIPADLTGFTLAWSALGVEVEEQLSNSRKACAGKGRVYVLGRSDSQRKERSCHY